MKSLNGFLCFILACLFSIAASGQVPRNYVVSPGNKTYTKLQNPLIKTGKAVQVLVVKDQAYLEGDIALGSIADLDRYQNLVGGLSVTTDDNLTSARWERGIIPFVIASGFTNAEKNIIRRAMNHHADNTNVCFVNRTNEGSYIKFKKYTVDELGFSGGSSHLGKCFFCTDGQEIKISSVTNAVVRHEIGHALGLLHEQAREDRDNSVEILRDNIKAGFEGQFDQSIYSSTDAGAYDFNSIMHYFSTAFGKKVDGVTKQTIRRRSDPDDQSFGRSSVLSAGDIQGINSMYPDNNPVCMPITELAPGELEIGGSKSVTVRADREENFTGVFMRKGQTFEFTTQSPAWKNGSRETDCDGYTASALDALRRHGNMKMMALVGEIYRRMASDYTGTSFKIGCGSTITSTKSGYLIAFANDMMLAYGDNSGTVTLTVRRTQ